MGFSKAVAEKSLFMTQQKGIEKAMDWIYAHENDPDFEEALVIVSSTGPLQQKDSEFSKLSPAEKLAYTKKMQEQARAQIAAKEAARAKESEANRVLNDKKLIEIKKLNDEAQFKKDIEEREREKKR